MVCAHAVRVAMVELEGVESVEVSLNQGTATLKLKGGNRIDPFSIRRIAVDNGFTPKGAAVRVEGRLIEREGKRLLEVEGPDQAYRLEAQTGAEHRFAEVNELPVGAKLTVDGYLPEGTEPSSLQVREFVLSQR